LELESHRAPSELAQARALTIRLAERLALVELYTILSPLERLYQASEPSIRAAVIRSLSRFFYKRTFITLRQALSDPDPSVVAEATRAVEELHFSHAFDPLARIYRECRAPEARAAALRALAKIDTVEAAEMLLGVIQHDGHVERSAAIEALKGGKVWRAAELARERMPLMSPETQTALRSVLEGRRGDRR
jgi:HEAT repeat protein